MTDTTTATAVPPRPKYYDDAVREIAVESIIADVTTWLNQSSQFEQKALKEVLVRCIDSNAYEYAQNLERRYGWSPDAELVNILDDMSLGCARDKVVAEWVKSNDVKIPFAVGDRVCSPSIKAGTVRELLHATAQIVIASDEDKNSPHIIGRIEAFEDVVLITGTIGEAAPEGGAA